MSFAGSWQITIFYIAKVHAWSNAHSPYMHLLIAILLDLVYYLFKASSTGSSNSTLSIQFGFFFYNRTLSLWLFSIVIIHFGHRHFFNFVVFIFIHSFFSSSDIHWARLNAMIQIFLHFEFNSIHLMHSFFFSFLFSFLLCAITIVSTFAWIVSTLVGFFLIVFNRLKWKSE